jgi:hypothetical protein
MRLRLRCNRREAHFAPRENRKGKHNMSAKVPSVTLSATELAALVAKAIADSRPVRKARNTTPVAPLGPETEKERALRESCMSPGFPRRAILEKLLDRGLGEHSVSELAREFGFSAATLRARANNANWMCNKYPKVGYVIHVSEDGETVSLVRTSAQEGALETKEKIEGRVKRDARKQSSPAKTAPRKRKQSSPAKSPAVETETTQGE